MTQSTIVKMHKRQFPDAVGDAHPAYDTDVSPFAPTDRAPAGLQRCNVPPACTSRIEEADRRSALRIRTEHLQRRAVEERDLPPRINSEHRLIQRVDFAAPADVVAALDIH